MKRLLHSGAAHLQARPSVPPQGQARAGRAVRTEGYAEGGTGRRDAVYEALIGVVLGEGAWDSFPDEVRQILTENGPALLAELGYVNEVMPDAAAFATIDKPTLLVAASESPPEQREMTEAMADALPNARTALVAGGHLIDSAAPQVLAFIEELLESQ